MARQTFRFHGTRNQLRQRLYALPRMVSYRGAQGQDGGRSVLNEMVVFANVVRSLFVANFHKKSTPGATGWDNQQWAKLSERTIAKKKSDAILKDKCQLIASITLAIQAGIGATIGQLFIVAVREGAVANHRGCPGRNLPARPFWPQYSQWPKSWRDIAHARIGNVIAAAIGSIRGIR